MSGNNSGNKYEEKTFQIDPVFKGRIISLQIEHVELPNGQKATREVIKHPGAVAVLAIHDGKMIVVEQYRKPLGRSLVEIPAGKLEPGEDLAEAAKRELQEETGFTGEVEWVSSFYTSPGFADEILHLFVADQLTAGAAKPDEDEFIDCEAISLETAKQYIAEGRIQDAKTITAVYAWQLHRLTGSYT
jgi:ADP-ribose pyrophosphatase